MSPSSIAPLAPLALSKADPVEADDNPFAGWSQFVLDLSARQVEVLEAYARGAEVSPARVLQRAAGAFERDGWTVASPVVERCASDEPATYVLAFAPEHDVEPEQVARGIRSIVGAL